MPTVVVVGASADRGKFGNKCVRAYADRGWTVIPVHPKETSIEGLPVVPALAKVTGPVDRISFYLPPAVGLGVIEAAAPLRAKSIYLNPGAASPELLAKGKSLGLPVLESCAIVAIGASPADYD